MLETLGIAHGREFKPDERMRGILTEAAKMGRAIAETVSWHPRVPKKDLHTYKRSTWKRIFISDDPTFPTPDYLAIEQREYVEMNDAIAANGYLLQAEFPYEPDPTNMQSPYRIFARAGLSLRFSAFVEPFHPAADNFYRIAFFEIFCGYLHLFTAAGDDL